MLLLAHALQLFVNLLRALDSIGVVRLGRIRLGSAGRACIGWRDDGIGLGLCEGWMHRSEGRFAGFGSVV